MKRSTTVIVLSSFLFTTTALAGGGGPGPRNGFRPPVKMKNVVARTAPTQVQLRRLRVRGGLNRRQVRKVFVGLSSQVQACTQIEVARLRGRMNLQLQVQPDGSVRAWLKRSTLGLALIDFCIRGIFEKARFPKRRRASVIDAQLRFTSTSVYTHTLRRTPPAKRRSPVRKQQLIKSI